MGLEDQWQFLKGGDIYAVRAGRCGPTYSDIDIADVRPEQVGDRCLYERSPTVVGTRDMCAAGLPGDVHGAIGAIHGDGRLGGIGLTGNPFSKPKDVLSKGLRHQEQICLREPRRNPGQAE